MGTTGDTRRLAKATHDLLVDRDPATGSWTVTSRRWMRSFMERAIARRSFPNDNGNYRRKRVPRPSSKALTPNERFVRLAAHYLSHAKTYRNPPTRRDCADLLWPSRLANTRHTHAA